jgi:hypothetical protein
MVLIALHAAIWPREGNAQGDELAVARQKRRSAASGGGLYGNGGDGVRLCGSIRR